jgi:hypothetical protein
VLWHGYRICDDGRGYRSFEQPYRGDMTIGRGGTVWTIKPSPVPAWSRIAITAEAFEAISRTLPLGSVG